MAGGYRFTSGTLELAGHLATPPRHQATTPAVVLCHSFRAGEGGAPSTAFTHPQLADRIANELGWVALSFTCRGAGDSEGQFSLGGWLTDIRAAIDHVAGLPGVTRRVGRRLRHGRRALPVRRRARTGE